MFFIPSWELICPFPRCLGRWVFWSIWTCLFSEGGTFQASSHKSSHPSVFPNDTSWNIFHCWVWYRNIHCVFSPLTVSFLTASLENPRVESSSYLCSLKKKQNELSQLSCAISLLTNYACMSNLNHIGPSTIWKKHRQSWSDRSWVKIPQTY